MHGREPDRRAAPVAVNEAPTVRVDAAGAPLRKAARGSLVNFAGSAVSAVATLGLTVLITRLATQSQVGVFFSVTSLFLLATSLAQLGTNTGLVYFLSGARARGDLAHADTYMRTAARPVMAASMLIGLLLFVTAAHLGQVLSPGFEPQLVTAIQVMAFFVPCAAVVNLALAGTQGLGTMKVNATVDGICRPLLQLVLVGGALAVAGPDTIGTAWAVAYLPVAVLAWWWWRRLRGRVVTQEHDRDFRPARDFWTFTSPRALAAITQTAMQRLDILLVGALAGLPAAAVYAAATRFLVLGQMAGRAVSLSIQPLVGEALARSAVDDARHLYQVATAWLVLTTWPVYLTLMIFSQAALGLFGGDYQVGGSVLVLLCGTMLLATACGMVTIVLNMAGRSLWNLLNVLAAFAVNISLDLLLIPKIGLMGAAIGWGAAIVVANLLPLSQIWGSVGLHPFGRASLLAMALAGVAFGAIPLLLGRVTDDAWSSITLTLTTSVLVYVAGIVALRRPLRMGEVVRAAKGRRGVDRRLTP